jgi:hypothetical protein
VAWVAGRAGAQVVVVHLDVRRRIASFAEAEGRPHGAALVAGSAGLQWWLPTGDTVLSIDPLRWQPLERQRLPAPVRALHAAGKVVWAWVERAESPLLGWRDGRWQPAEAGSAEPLHALALDAERSTLLRAGPETVRALDAGGRAAGTWRLDAGVALRGVAAFPA